MTYHYRCRVRSENWIAIKNLLNKNTTHNQSLTFDDKWIEKLFAIFTFFAAALSERRWLTNEPLDWISQNELSTVASFLGHVHCEDNDDINWSSSLSLYDKREIILDFPHEISTEMKLASFDAGDGDAITSSLFISAILPPLKRCALKSIDSKRNPIDFSISVSSITSIGSSCLQNHRFFFHRI